MFVAHFFFTLDLFGFISGRDAVIGGIEWFLLFLFARNENETCFFLLLLVAVVVADEIFGSLFKSVTRARARARGGIRLACGRRACAFSRNIRRARSSNVYGQRY